MNRINLTEKLARFSAHWQPKIIAELNGQYVKLVKIKGEFVWHHHANEDELFLVVSGSFRMDYRDPASPRADRSLTLREGEMVVVPRGVEHRPVADEECAIMLFEPASTVNTGSAGGPRTVPQLERI